MSKKLLRSLSVALAATFLAFILSPTQAETIFSSSFVQPEFSDGDIGFGGANPDAIVGQGGYSVSDSAGVGTLNGPAGGFQRAIFGWNPNDNFDEARVNGLSAPAFIRVVAEDLTFNPTGNPVAVFGLSNINGDNILGGSGLAAGVQLAYDAADGSIYIDRNTDFPGNLDIDTGFDSGEAFDLELLFHPTGGGMYDVDILVNNASVGISTGVTPNFDNPGTDTGGHIQGQTGPGPFTVNALHLEVVPEPSALLLGGLAVVGLAGMRRRCV